MYAGVSVHAVQRSPLDGNRRLFWWGNSALDHKQHPPLPTPSSQIFEVSGQKMLVLNIHAKYAALGSAQKKRKKEKESNKSNTQQSGALQIHSSLHWRCKNRRKGCQAFLTLVWVFLHLLNITFVFTVWLFHSRQTVSAREKKKALGRLLLTTFSGNHFFVIDTSITCINIFLTLFSVYFTLFLCTSLLFHFYVLVVEMPTK